MTFLLSSQMQLLKRSLMCSAVLPTLKALVVIPTKFAFFITNFAVACKANKFFSPSLFWLNGRSFLLCLSWLRLQPIRDMKKIFGAVLPTNFLCCLLECVRSFEIQHTCQHFHRANVFVNVSQMPCSKLVCANDHTGVKYFRIWPINSGFGVNKHDVKLRWMANSKF